MEDHSVDTDEPPLCRVTAGERLYFLRGGGFLHSNGSVWPPGVECMMEKGSGFAVLMGERPSSSLSHEESKMDPKTEGVSEVALPVAPAAPVAQDVPVVPAPVTLQPAGEGQELGAVLGLGSMLQDNPWAPLVIIVLAIVAVFGGRQGWKFYSERAAQHHELELKKLDLQARVAGLNGAQPPPCQTRDVEQDQRISKLAERMEEQDKRMAAVERRMASFTSADSDAMEEVEKRFKKVERAIAALKNEEA